MQLAVGPAVGFEARRGQGIGLDEVAERKVSAWIQWRIGPNRVGPWGLLQPLADGVKFIFKEELVPEGANPWLFRLSLRRGK